MFKSCQNFNPLQKHDLRHERLTFHYFTLAGRGELSKLIAAVGGLDLNVVNYALDLENPEADYKKKAKELGFEGFGLPLLEHDGFVLNQSGAIQDYLVRTGKQYPKLTAKQHAIDDLFSLTLEDAIAAAAKVVFKVNKPDSLSPILDKLLGQLELYVPETGFVHGLDTPTKADLSVLVLMEATLPFGVAAGMANLTSYAGKYPLLRRLADKVKTHPRVSAYLESDECTLKKTPS